MTDVIKSSDYRDWLRDLKRQIKTGQVRAALSVNSQMIVLYWDLGRQITEKQESARWGSGFWEQPVPKLNDLNCPQLGGNLQLIDNQQYTKMKQFVSQLISIPWGHQKTIWENVLSSHWAGTIVFVWEKRPLAARVGACNHLH